MTDLVCHQIIISQIKNHKPLCQQVNIHIPAGRVVPLMGASGIGKSSIIAYLSGLLPQGLTGSGQVILKGQNITNWPAEKRRVGLLFQDDLLFPHLSVAQNLAFGVPQARAQRRLRVQKALADCGLEHLGDADPATLSGGQRARIALQRTLLAEPEALLLDEPFGKLDQNLREKFRDYVFQHVERLQLPCLMVSHDIADTQHEAVEKIIHLQPAD